MRPVRWWRSTTARARHARGRIGRVRHERAGRQGPGDHADRAGAATGLDAEVQVARDGDPREPHGLVHPLRGRGRRDRSGNGPPLDGHQSPRLPDPLRPHVLERVEAQHVGLRARPERSELAHAVVVGGVGGGHHQGVDLGHPVAHREGDAIVEVAGLEQGVGLPVVGAQRHAVGAVTRHGGDQGLQVLAGRTLPHEDPHALAPLLLGLRELRALVVGLHPGGQVGVERATTEAGGVPVHPATSCGLDASEHLGIAGDDTRIIHDLGHPDGPVLLHQRLHLRGQELRARALEGGGRHAARRAHAEGEGQPIRRLDEGHDSGYAEDVGDLVGIRRDRGRAEGQHGADELVDPQLGGLEVHVRVHEPRHERGPRDIHGLYGLAGPPTGHAALGDGEVRGHPLTRPRGQHPSAAEKQVGGCLAPGHGEDPRADGAAGHGLHRRC